MESCEGWDFYPEGYHLNNIEEPSKDLVNLDECVFKKCCKKFKKKGKNMCKSCPKR